MGFNSVFKGLTIQFQAPTYSPKKAQALERAIFDVLGLLGFYIFLNRAL